MVNQALKPSPSRRKYALHGSAFPPYMLASGDLKLDLEGKQTSVLPKWGRFLTNIAYVYVDYRTIIVAPMVDWILSHVSRRTMTFYNFRS